MKKVALSEVKDDLSRYLHVAEKEDVVITRHGKPAGILIGFQSEDDWKAIQETIYLLSVPGMRESIRQGLKTPIKECSKEPGW